MNTLERMISGIDKLMPASVVSDKLMSVISNPHSSSADLIKLVKYDQSLTVNLLRLSNSAYVGAVKKITSIKQAMALLGMDKVVSLIRLANNAENFNGAHQGYDLSQGELWKYSVSSAIISQELAREKGISNISTIFTAALVKDIGKVIMSAYISEKFAAIQHNVQAKGQTFLDAERDVLGIDHAHLGAMAATKWHFPPELIEVIKFHHEPLNSGGMDQALCVVYVADCICMMLGQGVGADGLAYRYYQEAVDHLRLTAVDIQKIIVRFREKYEEIDALINVSGG